MKAICEAPTRAAAMAALRQAMAELEKKAPQVARLLEEHREEILGVYALPEAHRKHLPRMILLVHSSRLLK